MERSWERIGQAPSDSHPAIAHEDALYQSLTDFIRGPSAASPRSHFIHPAILSRNPNYLLENHPLHILKRGVTLATKLRDAERGRFGDAYGRLKGMWADEVLRVGTLDKVKGEDEGVGLGVWLREVFSEEEIAGFEGRVGKSLEEQEERERVEVEVPEVTEVPEVEVPEGKGKEREGVEKGDGKEDEEEEEEKGEREEDGKEEEGPWQGWTREKCVSVIVDAVKEREEFAKLAERVERAVREVEARMK